MNFSLEYISVTQYRKQNVKSDVCSKIIDNKYLLNEQCAERVDLKETKMALLRFDCAHAWDHFVSSFFPPSAAIPSHAVLGRLLGVV